MSAIEQWLRDQGLAHLKEVFEREQIGLDTLRVLTESDLRDLRLPVGPRAKLLAAIQTLKESGAEPVSKATSVPAAVNEPVAFVAGDRRQLSVMFCDLVGSTELSRRLDPEELRALIRRYQDLCASAISRFEGYVAQYLGDGVLAYFGYPVALEAGAERAIRAALVILDRVAESGAQDHPLQVRIGVDTGLVVIGRSSSAEEKDRTAIGDTPNVAARVQSLAAPGQLVVSERTRVLAPGAFLYRDLGAHVLKGLDQPLRMWHVEGERSSETRFDALAGATPKPMVGREVEFEVALQVWRKAKAGKGQVLLLSGEPGIGKSRLLRALRERLAEENIRAWQYQCSPHFVNSALYPVIQHFERILQFKRDEAQDAKLGRLERLLTQDYSLPLQAVNLIARLLNLPAEAHYGALAMTPQRQKDETLKAWTEVIAQAARQAPLLLLFEDLHWADPTMIEALEVLLARVVQLPVLILMSYRPEFQAPWSGRASVTALTLARLDAEQTQMVAARIAGGKRLPEEITRHITGKTDGVPLFVEELTKAILESNQLKEEADRYTLSGPFTTMTIPSTLRDTLMARLDRLGSVKEVAQTGACIGREFAHELLALISSLPGAQLQEALDKLVKSELVFRRGGPSHASYVFKHALIQDASYDSLLKSQRVQLHTRIAQTIETHFPEIVQSEPELLAHHYTEAASLDRAIPLWHRAGELAMQRTAIRESIAHLDRGMEVASRLLHSPQREDYELDLRATLGSAWMALYGWAHPKVAEHLEPALSLAQSLNRHHHTVGILWGLWVYQLCIGELRLSLQRSRQLFDQAQKLGNVDMRMAGHWSAAFTHCWTGEHDQSLAHAEAVISEYDEVKHRPLLDAVNHDAKSVMGVVKATSEALIGFPDKSVKTLIDCFAHARRVGHPFNLTYVLTYSATVYGMIKDTARMSAVLDEAEVLGRSYGFPFFDQIWCPILRAWLKQLNGQYQEAASEFARTVPAWTGVGNQICIPLFGALQGECLALAGDHTGAQRFLQQGIEHAQRPGWEEAAFLAELYRCGALIAERQRDFSGAEREYRLAIQQARSQKAQTLELRSGVALARMMHDQGRSQEARELLQPIYDWFTEGFDTADLKSAKALLQDLERG
jgi:class 3 adenylate cyclase/DNA polymerase III delta prime subunit